MLHSLFKQTTTTTTEELLLKLKTTNNTIKGENIMSYTNNKGNFNKGNNTRKHLNKGENFMKKPTRNNFRRNNQTTNDQDFDNLLKIAVFEMIEEEQRLADKTLIPNARNFEKYLFVKEQLNKLAKSNNTKLEEVHHLLNADFTIKLYVLNIDEIKIISEVSKYCSAIGLDAEQNGRLTLCATVPDVFLVYEDEMAKRKNNTQPKQSII